MTGEYKYGIGIVLRGPDTPDLAFLSSWSPSAKQSSGPTRFCYSTNILAAQNSRRSMNWSFRDEPIPVGPVFSSLVMCPKAAPSEISESGSP